MKTKIGGFFLSYFKHFLKLFKIHNKQPTQSEGFALKKTYLKIYSSIYEI